MKLHQGRIPVFGEHEDQTISQIVLTASVGDVAGAALMADGHLGYQIPIGGVVAYREMIPPAGVGYDIACGNKAVKTNVRYGDLKPNLAKVMDQINKTISFGLKRGQINRDRDAPSEDPVFDQDAWDVVLPSFLGERRHITALKDQARNQLGTVGSGNHYVDLLVELPRCAEDCCWDDSLEAINKQPIWVACHFGSRGLGHKLASGFMNLARGYGWGERGGEPPMMSAPALLTHKDGAEVFSGYIEAMELAGMYAYAGRDWVVKQVCKILGASVKDSVHVHHNFAWLEEHDQERVWVVRKGATPLLPDQRGFIGGSMTDVSVIVKGVWSDDGLYSLQSAPHGSGRVMGRMAAKGKRDKRTGEWKREPGVTQEMMDQAVRDAGIELRGAGVDESPFVYRKLLPVLAEHGNVEIEHVLKPIGVAMAGEDVRDPYRD